MPDHLRRLAQLATGQHGAITTAQARAAGLNPAQLRRRVQSGVLERAGCHTFRSPFGSSSAIADLTALLLDCGDESYMSGRTAAALYGFDGFTLRPPFDVTVLRGRNVQRAHHHIHTTLELPSVDRATIDGLPAMAPARTLIDLARFVGPKQLTSAVDSALRDRLTSELHLHRRIVALRSRGRYGIPKLLAVIEGSEASRGGHSWLERRFLELCASAGLPRPSTQQVMTRTHDHLVRVDCHFPGTRVIVELLGYRWHRSRSQLTNDAARLNALVLEGLTPLQFTYDQVTCNENQVIAEVRAALAVAA